MLATIGLNSATVRSWFYHSRPVDETIEILELCPDEGNSREMPERFSARDCLEQADKMAVALSENKLVYARRLATLYIKNRNLPIT